MTYQAIRTELHELREQARTSPDEVNLTRAQELIGRLQRMGIQPRRVRLSLRQLGLSPRQLQRARLE